jgi:hypothetical protein
LRRVPALALTTTLLACSGADIPPGEVVGHARSRSTSAEPRILFGDLHVHTSYSIDAFLYSLPLFGGEGAHPPADACDFARHCAGLDFFAITDHAEALTPERWRAGLDSLRACDAVGGGAADVVPFAGFEWTQTGQTPDSHFGHKNVIYPSLEAERLPARPISALAADVMSRARFMGGARVAEAIASWTAPSYGSLLYWTRRLTEIPFCPGDVDTRELPDDCHESAPRPEDLFAKLDQAGLEALVIPHGLAWGIHAPRGSRLDVQLSADRHDPARQRLLEVFSGHGAGEVFDAELDAIERAQLTGTCPAPTDGHLPCCWRAGQLVRERCPDAGSAACEARVAEARQLVLASGRRPLRVLPDASVADWLDCDQTREAFKPVLSGRPRQSAQYALALSALGADPDERPLRFRFGLIGSSDNHTARAGSGYKQVARKGMSDARGIASEWAYQRLRPLVMGRPQDPLRAQPAPPEPAGFRGLLDVERGASFLYPGGLVAAHTTSRDRTAIWDALHARRVYGTSGPRILLWFDLINAPDGAGALPMGSALTFAGTPRFEVRAVGSRRQRPGCPDETWTALGRARVEQLCRSECHHPDDARHAIEAIEVVRIHPQHAASDPVAPRIEDPWRTLPCAPSPEGCVVRFEDPDFERLGRDAVYYVRALQAPTDAVNGDTLRPRTDERGHTTAVAPCYGNWRTGADDDCLAPVRERAWSSPIFLDQAGPARADFLLDRAS